MPYRYRMSILLVVTLAILAAVPSVHAAIDSASTLDGQTQATNVPRNDEAADAAQPVAAEEQSAAALPPPPSSNEPPPPSSDSQAGNSPGSQSARSAAPAQQTPIRPVPTAPPGGANSAASETPTFVPGLRAQARYTYDSDSGHQNIYVARLRLKAKGDFFGTARYGLEIKLDNLGRSEIDPKAELENAWLEFPVVPDLAFRVGLFDVPFSRNTLTSDSKLLLVDRSLIKDALTSLGLTDNTVGVLGHGRPFGGRFEYAAGIFNNLQFKRSGTTDKRSDSLMPAGRIVFHFLDPATPGGYADYYSSYLGQGRRLSLGTNSAYLRNARDSTGEFALSGWGADLFFSTSPFTLEAEYDRFRKEMRGGGPNIRGNGWYVQTGYLLPGYLFRRRAEITARHQELDPDVRILGNGSRWTSLGLNIYMQDHRLKMQMDYTFRRGPGSAVRTDVLQIQMQGDF